MADEVPIPDPALHDPEAFEIFRVWFANGTMHLSLGRRFDDPALWGVVLASVAEQAATYYEPGVPERSALEAIKQQFDAEYAAMLGLS